MVNKGPFPSGIHHLTAPRGGNIITYDPIFEIPDTIWKLNPADANVCLTGGVQSVHNDLIDSINPSGPDAILDGAFTVKATHVPAQFVISSASEPFGPNSNVPVGTPLIKLHQANIRYESANSNGWQYDFRGPSGEEFTSIAFYWMRDLSSQAQGYGILRDDGVSGMYFNYHRGSAGMVQSFNNLGRSGNRIYQQATSTFGVQTWVLQVTTYDGSGQAANILTRMNATVPTLSPTTQGTLQDTRVTTKTELFSTAAGLLAENYIGFYIVVNRKLSAQEIGYLESAVLNRYLGGVWV